MKLNKWIVIPILLLALLICVACLSSTPTTAKTNGHLPATDTPIPIPTNTKTPEATATVIGMRNPSGEVPAGMPVVIDNYVMSVDKSGMLITDDFVGFTIQLRVIDGQSHLFRYSPSSLRLRDDLGNYYDYYYTIGFTSCSESEIYRGKQIMVEPDEKVTIEPMTNFDFTSYFWWCTDGQDQYIPGFKAQIPANAKSLFLEFDSFGPFSGFSYQFDL